MTITNTGATPSVSPVSIGSVPATPLRYSDVTSFTYGTGVTHMMLMEQLARWATAMVPVLNGNFETLDEAWQADTAALLVQLNAAIATQAETVNSALETQQTSISDALESQQSAINIQLQQTLAALAGGQVEVVDPAIAGSVNLAGSQTRNALDALYAAKSVVDGLSTLVNSGRLSPTILDSKYANQVTDDAVLSLVNNTSSKTREAFNNLYERIRFQVYGGYLQFQYAGDASWSNLIDLSTLTGPRGLPGTTGNPGGNAEIAYAESQSTTSISTDASNVGLQDIPGLTISVTMPARPVMLKVSCLAQFIATTGSDACVQLIETTGGGATNILEVHGGYQQGSSVYNQLYAERRISSTAGTVRTFKLAGVQRTSTTWKVMGSATFPAWIAAHQC